MNTKNKKMTPVNLDLDNIDGSTLQQPDVKKWTYQLRVIEDRVLGDRTTRSMLNELHKVVQMVKVLNQCANVTRTQRNEITTIFCNITAIIGMRNSLSFESIVGEVDIDMETFDRIIGHKIKKITDSMADLFNKLQRGEINLEPED